MANDSINIVFTDNRSNLGASISAHEVGLCAKSEANQDVDTFGPHDSRYRLLFDANPHPMWVYDVETLAFLAVNEVAVETYGYSRSEFLALTIADIRPREDIPALIEQIAALQNGHDRNAGEWRHQLKSGTIIHTETASNALVFDGRQARLVLVTDVTGRRFIEEALRTAESKYRGLFEHAVEGIFRTSPEGRYLEANPALARIYGYSSPKQLLAGLTDIGSQLYVDPDRRDDFVRLMNEHDTVSSFESKVYRNDGAIIWISESSRAVRDTNGQLIYYEGIVEDITSRKNAEREIQNLNSQLLRRLAQVKSLRCIDVAITEGKDLNLTLDVCLDQVIGHLEVNAAAIVLCDQGDQSLVPAVSRGLRPESWHVTPPPVGLGIHRRPASTPAEVGVDEFGHCSWHTEVAAERFACSYVVPLIANGQVKGLLEVFLRVAADQEPEWLSFLETLAGQAAIAIDNACLFHDLHRSHDELAEAYDATIEGWSRALDLRDEETKGHSQRVTQMTLTLARTMGMSETDLVHVRRGALLHDIGKMGIPDRILHKPGPLSQDEWRIMRRHPQYAFEMLRPIAFLRPALGIPHAHHERWDGTGYPLGLKGEEIPLAARIFAAVDIWDALRSDRPYRPAWSECRVREHLRSLAGTSLEPAVVETLLAILATHPPMHSAGVLDHTTRDTCGDEQVKVISTEGTSLDHETCLEPNSAVVQERLKILVVENEDSSARELTHQLEALGHSVVVAVNEDEAWRIVQQGETRLVIFDWTTMEIDGPRLCRSFHVLSGEPYIYMLVVGSLSVDEDRLDGLHSAADDFLAKPFNQRELKVRLEIARRILGVQHKLEQKNARLAELVHVDSLTGLKNRRHFREAMDAAFSFSMRHDQFLSLVMLDVDDFKTYNDTFGHPAGDEVLFTIAELLRWNSRGQDVVSRYGGEEFAILLPATNSSEALNYAKRLREAIAEHCWPRSRVTASLGIATSTPETRDADSLVELADRALYESKRLGRDRVTHHGEQDLKVGARFAGDRHDVPVQQELAAS